MTDEERKRIEAELRDTKAKIAANEAKIEEYMLELERYWIEEVGVPGCIEKLKTWLFELYEDEDYQGKSEIAVVTEHLRRLTTPSVH
jgi:hypothetical protein